MQSIAYTFDFGGGVTVDAGVDDRRTKPLINLGSAAALKIGAEPTDTHASQSWPDTYLALHIDETWGFVAASAGIHNVNAGYYSANGAATGPFASFKSCAQASTTQCGHPSDAVGYFGQIGGELKLPALGPGDKIGWGARYSGGCDPIRGRQPAGQSRSVRLGQHGGARLQLRRRLRQRFEHRADAGDGVPGRLHALLDADPEHRSLCRLFQDHLRRTAQSYFAGAVCGAAGTGAVAQTQFSVSKTLNDCNPSYAYMELGSRTTWTPFPDLQISAQIMYNQVWSGFKGAATLLTAPAVGARPTGAYIFGDQHICTGYFRIARTYSSAD